jgi:hypothetical protein
MTDTATADSAEQKHAVLLDGDLFKCGINEKPATPQTVGERETDYTAREEGREAGREEGWKRLFTYACLFVSAFCRRSVPCGSH